MRLTLHHAHSFSALDKHLEAERDRLFALNGDASAAEDDLGVGDEEESPELLSLDPKEWKVFLFFYDEMIYAEYFLLFRNKTITLSLVFLICDTKLHLNKSKLLVSFFFLIISLILFLIAW